MVGDLAVHPIGIVERLLTSITFCSAFEVSAICRPENHALLFEQPLEAYGLESDKFLEQPFGCIWTGVGFVGDVGKLGDYGYKLESNRARNVVLIID